MNNNRSRKPSGSSLGVKLEPLTTQSQFSTKTHKSKAATRPLYASENQTICSKDVKTIVKKDDVLQLQRKIIGFDAKDDNSIPSSHLFHLRRNYDDLSKQLTKKNIEINNAKGEIEVMKRTITLSREGEDAYRRNLEEIQKNVENLKNKQIIQQMTSKSLEAVITRMKKDQFVHKTRVTLLDQKVKVLESQIKQCEVKNLGAGEEHSYNLVTASQVRQQYQQTRKQRQINFNLYQSLIQKRQSMELNEEERIRNTEQIQSMAHNDINDSKHIKHKKLMLVQRFLRLILKRNMCHIEDKYEDVKNCYNTIRSKTTISDPKELSRLYFEMEVQYSKQLENITDLEEKQKQLANNREKLEKQWRLLQAKAWEPIQEQNGEDEATMLKNRKQTDEKWLRLNLIQIRMKNSIFNISKKLSQATDKPLPEQTSVESQITGFCKQLIEISQQLESQEKYPAKFNQLVTLEALTNKEMDKIYSDQQSTDLKHLQQ